MQCSIIYSIQYIISSQFYTIVPNVITSIILIILIMWNRRGSTAGTENKCSFYSTLVNTEPIYSTPVQVFWCFCTSRWSLYLLLALCLDQQHYSNRETYIALQLKYFVALQCTEALFRKTPWSAQSPRTRASLHIDSYAQWAKFTIFKVINSVGVWFGLGWREKTSHRQAVSTARQFPKKVIRLSTNYLQAVSNSIISISVDIINC